MITYCRKQKTPWFSPERSSYDFHQRSKWYSKIIYYLIDCQLVVIDHDASTSQVAKWFLAGRPLTPNTHLQRLRLRKNPEPK